MPCNGVIYKLWGFLFAMEQAGRRVAAVFLAARETLLKERSRAQASYPPLSQTGSPAFVPLSGGVAAAAAAFYFPDVGFQTLGGGGLNSQSFPEPRPALISAYPLLSALRQGNKISENNKIKEMKVAV